MRTKQTGKANWSSKGVTWDWALIATWLFSPYCAAVELDDLISQPVSFSLSFWDTELKKFRKYFLDGFQIKMVYYNFNKTLGFQVIAFPFFVCYSALNCFQCLTYQFTTEDLIWGSVENPILDQMKAYGLAHRHLSCCWIGRCEWKGSKGAS